MFSLFFSLFSWFFFQTSLLISEKKRSQNSPFTKKEDKQHHFQKEIHLKQQRDHHFGRVQHWQWEKNKNKFILWRQVHRNIGIGLFVVYFVVLEFIFLLPYDLVAKELKQKFLRFVGKLTKLLLAINLIVNEFERRRNILMFTEQLFIHWFRSHWLQNDSCTLLQSSQWSQLMNEEELFGCYSFSDIHRRLMLIVIWWE